jgi:hypothetical protein
MKLAMNQPTLLWITAIILTVFTAYFQRVTGPTYPLTGKVTLNGRSIPFRLDRSHAGPSDAQVTVKTRDAGIQGVLSWKRHNTDDPWTRVPMRFEDGSLVAELPHQPMAGKLVYKIELQEAGHRVSIPEGDPLVIRFRGETPLAVLVPHVLAMFGAMLLSTRTGLECFRKEPNLRRLTFWTLGFLFVGGFIFGPLMQYYAFNTWWTGWPFGTDLTDSKTAIAFIAWVIAAIALFKSKNPKRWALSAAVLLLIVYLIPHSVLGSELDYKELEKQPVTVEPTQ